MLCAACDPIVGGVGLSCAAAGQSQAVSCEAGYLFNDNDPPAPDACEAAECPAGSTGMVPGNSGTGRRSGCTTDAGHTGTVRHTAPPPKRRWPHLVVSRQGHASSQHAVGECARLAPPRR